MTLVATVERRSPALPALSVEGVGIGHGTRALFHVPSLRAEPGEFICLLGRNGAGKTTLLRTLAALHPPTAGIVRFGAEDLHRLAPAQRARLLSVVLTERLSGTGLTVRDVVELGRQPYADWRGTFDDEDRASVARAVAAVDLEAFLARELDDLSDGERQRVMIARGLAQSPTMLLLDEVTAFLDLPSRVRTMSMLRRVARELGCLVILSSHDLDLALGMADRIWLLPGDGTLLDDVPEALALGGHLGRTFDQDEVRFSVERGEFELIHGLGTRIAVEGDVPEAFWTRQAVRRLGYAVEDRATDPACRFRVTVERHPEGTRWTRRSAELDTATYATLRELLAAMRTEAPLASG